MSLDNSGMHIFRASWPSLSQVPQLSGLGNLTSHHLACAITFSATIDGAILRILPSQLISLQLLAISVFFLALLCRPLERVLGPQNDPQRITKGSSGSKAHCLSVTRAAPEHISMNESSCRPHGPRLLERLLSSSPLPQVPKFPAQTFGAPRHFGL